MPRHEGARRGAQSRRGRHEASPRGDIGHEVGLAVGLGSGNDSEFGDAGYAGKILSTSAMLTR